MNCTILTIGTELLMGQIINTNTTYLSNELNSIGINVLYHFTVGDNPDRLENILKIANSLSDMVITTGGLGPTQDDLTKEIIAKSFDKKLILHEETLKNLNYFFEKISKKMTSNNIKQAYFPKDSIILPNDFGTAPGFIIEQNNKVFISLPGPPNEMSNMFSRSVKPYLLNNSKETIQSRIIKFIGIGESTLESELEDLISNQTNPTLATYAKQGEVSLRITGKTESISEFDALIEPIITKIKDRLHNYVFSYDNEDLELVVGNLLINKNLTISIAESCTGGLLSASLTSIPGISKIFDRSFVTYSNNSKIEELDVNKQTLNTYGAVSSEVALEMCKGLKKYTKTNIAVSITGIAGPSGGSSTKPVGLVYIAVSTDKDTYLKELHLTGDREKIRNYAKINALNFIRKIIKKEHDTC